MHRRTSRLGGQLVLTLAVLGTFAISAPAEPIIVGQPPERGIWKIHAREPNTPGSRLVVKYLGSRKFAASSVVIRFGALTSPKSCSELSESTVRVKGNTLIGRRDAHRDGGLIERYYAVRAKINATINGKITPVTLRIFFFNAGVRTNGNVTTRMLSGMVELTGTDEGCRGEFAGGAQRRGPE